ncbi:MFS transporter [Robbsia andropogonis]|uniref:MFS transporter n=1 Tax=Robbsia andropogonis TaxID=28092 RepID=UPI000467161C|nr:MFS transporter [Robbsia andropogonis]
MSTRATSSPSSPAGGDRAPAQVLRLTVVLFLSYLAVASALPIVSAYAVHSLHLSNALGGLAVGIAFFSTILTRNIAGRLADQHGGRYTMQRGLWIYSAASCICLLSVAPVFPHTLGFIVLLAGRLLLGVGESFALVGMLGWSIGLMGTPRSGKVMAWMGAGMYGAFAVGGPLGLGLYHVCGFGGVMVAAILFPLLGLLLVQGVPGVAPQSGTREPFWRIIGRIWRAGAAVGLQGVGFAALGAFISLYFQQKGWSYAGMGLTAFGVGFVAVRMLCGNLPDRIGGTRVAMVSLVVEACGQFLIWSAPGPAVALVGALLTGLGCSMVFPGMGSDVVKQIPPQLRGTAVGGFAAFQDIAYGATGPVAGVLADHAGYAVVFLIGGICALLGLVAAASAHRQPTAQSS